MQGNQIHFCLAPDGTSARRIRKVLADDAPGIYLSAGTWPELMAQAASVYLLPPETPDWPERLKQAASGLEDAFWSPSLKVAPRETVAELQAALIRLLEAEGPAADRPNFLSQIPGNSRLHRRLSDLVRLLEAVGGLPGHLQQMAELLASPELPLRAIRVYHPIGTLDIDPWQKAVLQKLQDDCPPQDPLPSATLEKIESNPETTHPALEAARNLFSGRTALQRGIDGVRVLAVRDSLAEAEIVAGLIQKAIENGGDVSDIGLLLPDDPLSLMAVEDAFRKCGLPLSGFCRPAGRRDLGRDTVRAFLLCLRKPAPIMAIASLLTSPLMPWPAEEGHALAQAVMDGDVLLKSTRKPTAARTVMDLLDQGAAAPAELQRSLNRLASLMTADETLYDHLQRALDATAQLQTLLSGAGALEWEPLLYRTRPESLHECPPVDYWQEGIPVLREGMRPWCSVKHLFVLGFNEGHYPAGVGPSAVFTEAEWEAIAAAGWPVVTNDDLRQRRRLLLADQLAAATETLTFLFSRRDAVGQTLEPSSSLIFLARSLGVEADELIYDLDRSEDIRRMPDLPLAEVVPASPPRPLPIADIEVGVDLLKAFGREAGETAPLSPSGAETLMVSPFAWLLRRLGCQPKEWGADAFDVMMAGTLAHRVFEILFQPGLSLPAEEEIAEKGPKILQEWMLQIAPFLRSSDWRVERYKFEAEVLRAAVHWKKLLTACNGSVVGAEQWLRGCHGEVPLHGQSDLLVGLPSGKLLVVDYKKSSSGKRRERMRGGFDLQAHLYRVMIRTGGLPGFDPPPQKIGIVYYLMNDTTALADSPVDDDGTVPGWEVLTNDISFEAMRHLDRRIDQIRNGAVRLNTADDEKWWKDNAALPIYALDDSPLLRLFMHPGAEEGAS